MRSTTRNLHEGRPGKRNANFCYSTTTTTTATEIINTV